MVLIFVFVDHIFFASFFASLLEQGVYPFYNRSRSPTHPIPGTRPMRVSNMITRVFYSFTLLFVILAVVVTAAPPQAPISPAELEVSSTSSTTPFSLSSGGNNEINHDINNNHNHVSIDDTNSIGTATARNGQQQQQQHGSHRGWRTLLRETWDVVAGSTSRSSGFRLSNEPVGHVARPRGRYMRRGRAHP